METRINLPSTSRTIFARSELLSQITVAKIDELKLRDFRSRITMQLRVLLALHSLMTLLAIVETASAADNQRPNILWLSAEDISSHLGCYGDPHAITPRLDHLATEGVRYTHAFTTAGVCAPCRSGIITGMYQTTLGTQHMRCQAKLPDFIQPFPTYLRKAGYFCTNKYRT